jgi:RNA polymerase sigma-B factor
VSAAEPDTDELFLRLQDEPALRDELVRRHRGLAESIARRFRGRGEHEDLAQVASLALVKAVDRYDPGRGVPFAAFASTTIVGELKRHLRDTVWAVRVPRTLQETGLEVGRAVEALTQRLGRSPTIAEVAHTIDRTEDEVLEGLEVGTALEAVSLDAPVGDETGPHRELGEHDQAMELVEAWTDVAEAIRQLPERERRILHLRFFRGMSQSAIAQELGISQMHVSRLLARTLATLREEVAE